MATPTLILTGIGLGISAIGAGASIGFGASASAEQDKAQKAADLAQRAQWKTELETHLFNIDVAKKGLREGTADISREGARFQRLQGAAMGASGATLGVGTPLMNMIRTAAGIERDKSRLAAQTQLDIDFAQGEIDALTELLGTEGLAVLRRHKTPKGGPTSGTTGLVGGVLG